MSANTHFDGDAAAEHHSSGHPDCPCRAENRPVGPLEPHPWTPGLHGHDPVEAAGRVDFDDDEGRTIATVRITPTGPGYTVHIEQLSDLDNLIIIHSNY